MAEYGYKFKRLQKQACCSSCLGKEQRISQLEAKVSSMQLEIQTLKGQKQQHEQALRYLFEKVERLLKAEAERHLNASHDSAIDRQIQQDMQYATPYVQAQPRHRMDLSDSSFERHH